MDSYRVEKDGVSFHVQADQLGAYADSGYRIYRTVEQEVEDVAEAMASAKSSGRSLPADGGANA